jgi:hypothetical protein
MDIVAPGRQRSATHVASFSLTLTHTLTYSLCLSGSHSLTHSHTLSVFHSLAHTHTLSLTVILCVCTAVFFMFL